MYNNENIISETYSNTTVLSIEYFETNNESRLHYTETIIPSRPIGPEEQRKPQTAHTAHSSVTLSKTHVLQPQTNCIHKHMWRIPAQSIASPANLKANSCLRLLLMGKHGLIRIQLETGWGSVNTPIATSSLACMTVSGRVVSSTFHKLASAYASHSIIVSLHVIIQA